MFSALHSTGRRPRIGKTVDPELVPWHRIFGKAMSDSEFEREARQKQPSTAMEILRFARRNWWLAPIVLVLVGLAGLMLLGSTSAGPLIYTIF